MRILTRSAVALTLLITPALLNANEPSSLADLARQADFIALAQIRDTDYLRRRDIPVSGSAYLRVLITYAAATDQTAFTPSDDEAELGADSGADFGPDTGAGEEVAEVYEQGLHEGECYFPNPSVLEEGRRYLVFLRRDPDDPERFRGLPEGCAIDVLVDRENGYVVRMPVTGIRLNATQTAQLERLARPVRFSDPYAVVADDDLAPARRDAMRAAGQIAPWAADDHASDSADPLPPSPSSPRQWTYTLGVPLSEFRKLLELEPDS